MKILVCGASGFIGAAICDQLIRAGHCVVRGVRQAQASNPPTEMLIDYERDTDPSAWASRLIDIDVVINAVGILVESDAAQFDTLHCQAPVALFRGCAQAGVRRVIQISALGADTGPEAYFASKRMADEALKTLPLQWVILRPGLVYGEAGRSARAFRMWASLPLLPLPGEGRQTVQPLHIDDLAALVSWAVHSDAAPGRCVDAPGPDRCSLSSMLLAYRAQMDLPAPVQLSIPASVMRLAARIGSRLRGSWLTADTWSMLQRGNVGDPTRVTSVLGRPLIRFPGATSPTGIAGMRAAALAHWRNPFFRWVLALIWIATGVASAFLYPVEDSLGLLEPVGLRGDPALVTLYAASALDIAMGVACLAGAGRRLWGIQILLVLGYTALVALCLPEQLIHPFGPVTKNMAVLALLIVLWNEEHLS
ncbi:SDR family oxidoreductase [Aromatoleum diolicum]|uniref:NAD(P)H-binding protein n=1 Tax=Aromatoleum diolicum TaxID=75796 RepID=A0ABX1QBZ7_9RHOO|nr:SDR family oxidoreductase [Aromatoleum diolicum]NMG75921.1 NAD(P)H-binding protein [Aromatoleum diolicum]